MRKLRPDRLRDLLEAQWLVGAVPEFDLGLYDEAFTEAHGSSHARSHCPAPSSERRPILSLWLRFLPWGTWDFLASLCHEKV